MPFDLDCADSDYRRDPVSWCRFNTRPPPTQPQAEEQVRAVRLVGAERPEALVAIGDRDTKPENESQ